MEKLPVCRICLVENVRMYVVVDKNIHELYEKLADIPFVTKDSRPMLACFFCYAKLKQSCQLQKKCLAAEKVFAQMTNKQNGSINRGQLDYSNGLMKSPIESINIVDVGQIEHIAIKEELPDVCERLDDIFEPLEEHQSDDLELEKINNNYSDEENTPLRYSESDLDNESLVEFQTEVKDDQRASDMRRSPVAKKLKLDTQRMNLEDIIMDEQKKIVETDTQFIQATQNRTSTPILKHECHICQRRFNNKCHLKYHIRAHTGEKPHKCDICQRSFSRNYVLNKHFRTHTGEKPHKCDTCQKSYANKSDLHKHISTHTGVKPYKCDMCPRSFVYNSMLKQHVRKHSGEKPFKCDICEKCFNAKGNLVNHVRSHTGERPFICDICKRSFIKKINLTNHIHTHTGLKPHKCDTCQRGFSNKSDLNKHIRIHTGEKPHKCDICQRRFSKKYGLIQHTRTHTGEKPHKCGLCERSFAIKSNLSKHFRVHVSEKIKRLTQTT